jgi:hypothetical protein
MTSDDRQKAWATFDVLKADAESANRPVRVVLRDHDEIKALIRSGTREGDAPKTPSRGVLLGYAKN